MIHIGMKMPKQMIANIEETERRQRKRKKASAKEPTLNKIDELEWKLEDCAQPSGKLIKFSGEGEKKKCHYENFEFRSTKYRLESSVLLVPEDKYGKPYVAIIKDIYTQGKEGYVKLDVQWFYRPEDVDKKYVRNWKSKDGRDLFYSFHRDEVSAESVKHHCLVYFTSDNNFFLNHGENPDFIVHKVYNTDKKRLWNLTHNDFNNQQKHEIGLLLEKTASLRVGDLRENTVCPRIGDLPRIEKKINISNSMYHQSSIPEWLFMKADRRNQENVNVASERDYKSILEDFDMLTGDLDRDQRLYELLEAIKHKGHATMENQRSYHEFFWPVDVVYMVCSLEKTLYDSMAKDKPKYNQRLEMLVDKLKNSQMLVERFLNGELKAEEIVAMKNYELSDHNDQTVDEIMAVLKEPISQICDPSTSRSVRH